MSQINPLLMKLITDGDNLAAHDILSALRGPDSSLDRGFRKAAFTAPIRAWVYGEDAYPYLGFSPMVAKALTKHVAIQILPDLPPIHTDDHFMNHIHQAVFRIAILERWVHQSSVQESDKWIATKWEWSV